MTIIYIEEPNQNMSRLTKKKTQFKRVTKFFKKYFFAVVFLLQNKANFWGTIGVKKRLPKIFGSHYFEKFNKKV